MRGDQEIKQITPLETGEVKIELLYGYDVILTPEETRDLIVQLQAARHEVAAKQILDTPLPKVNIRCEIKTEDILGSTYLNVIRVEQEDDGSYTAVTDYWPSEDK